MHNCVGYSMINTGIAVGLDKPVWINYLGEVVTEEEYFGYKVSLDIADPYYTIVLDEVGGNTNRKGYGNIGGELIICEPGKILQKKTTDNHYTVIALITLNGHNDMCTVTYTGVKPITLYGTG